MSNLPQKKPDIYSQINVHDFSTSHKLTTAQLLTMSNVAESRDEFDIAGRWKMLAEKRNRRSFDAQNTEQGRQAQAQKHRPPAGRAAAPTTFDRSDHLPVMSEEDQLGARDTSEARRIQGAQARVEQTRADQAREREGRELAAQMERMMRTQQL